MKLDFGKIFYLLCQLALASADKSQNLTGCGPDPSYKLAVNTTYCVGPESTTAVSACAAMAACAKLGESLLGPAAYNSLRNSKMTKDAWLGITDAAVERGSSPSGWQLVPGLEQLENLELWSVEQPNGEGEDLDCVIHVAKENGLHNYECNGTKHYRCQRPAGVDAATLTPKSYQRFFDAPVLTFAQDAPGCNIKSATAATAMLCGLSCSEKFGCVGFYHNAIRQECRLLLFFDAALKLDYDSEAEEVAWTKMLAFPRPSN